MDVEVTPREEDPAAQAVDPDPAVIEALDEADAEASAEVMHLLHEGVPLTLLADLADPEGPHSPEILADEGLPDDAWWVHEEPAGDDEPTPAEPDDEA